MIKDLLTFERSINSAVNGLIVAATLTGLITFVVGVHAVWLQWTVLAHTLVGIGMSLFTLPYLYVHFKRTLGFRRAGMLFSGLVLLLLFILCVLSGWHIMLAGRSEALLWVYQLHVVSTISFVVLTVLHVYIHVKFFPKRRLAGPHGTFPSVTPTTMRQILIGNVALVALVGLASVTYSMTDAPYSTEPVVANYSYDYGEHPFRPSQTETQSAGFIDHDQIANSHQCINCHQDIGEQWIASAHQQAAADPTYVTNINLLAKNKGMSATRYCEGCHAPVALLSGQLSEGGDHGGIEGTVANVHGISCMSCHGIHTLTHIKGVASYQFDPAKPYLFARSENPLLARLHTQLVKTSPKQHVTDVGGDILKDPKSCAACHTQFMDTDMNNWGWVKMQDDYGSWLASPFSKHEDENFATSDSTRCQDCHMPLVPSNDPSANKDGLVRSHNFAAANTFLPLLRNDTKQYQAVVDFLQSNKLRLSIDKPHRHDAIQNQHFIDETLRDVKEAPFFYYLGETAEIQLIVTNQGVGHSFPGGTTDINQAWVELTVHDAQGQQVFASGLIQPDGFVDPNAYFYKSIPVDRSGNEVWRHDLFNMVGESFRRVIKSGESDIVTYSFPIKPWVKGPLTVAASVKYRKLNQRYAKWALAEHYIDIPAIDMAWDSLEVPILIQPAVTASQTAATAQADTSP